MVCSFRGFERQPEVAVIERPLFGQPKQCMTYSFAVKEWIDPQLVKCANPTVAIMCAVRSAVRRAQRHSADDQITAQSHETVAASDPLARHFRRLAHAGTGDAHPPDPGKGPVQQVGEMFQTVAIFQSAKQDLVWRIDLVCQGRDGARIHGVKRSAVQALASHGIALGVRPRKALPMPTRSNRRSVSRCSAFQGCRCHQH